MTLIVFDAFQNAQFAFELEAAFAIDLTGINLDITISFKNFTYGLVGSEAIINLQIQLLRDRCKWVTFYFVEQKIEYLQQCFPVVISMF